MQLEEDIEYYQISFKYIIYIKKEKKKENINAFSCGAINWKTKYSYRNNLTNTLIIMHDITLGVDVFEQLCLLI
jgi:hypothetical protein